MIALLMLIVSSAVHAADAPKLDLADPWKRLAFARVLQSRDDTGVDEVAVAFQRLSNDPAVGEKAREELYHLTITQSVRPGWRDLYDTMLSSKGVSQDGRLVLATRAAQARVADPGTRPEGLRQLRALVKEAPRRADVRLALGDALLASDKADEARAMFQGTEGGAPSTEGIMLSLLALNRIDEAQEFAATMGLAGEHPLRQAAKAGTLAARAGALVAAGYADTAEALLKREDPRGANDGAWMLLVQQRLVQGQPVDAARILGKLVAADPSRSDLRRHWVSALLEAGDVRGAKLAAGTDEDSMQAVYAVELVSGSPDNAAERADDIGRAWRLAPNQPQVAKHRVALLLAQDRSREARDVVLPMLQARPRDAQLQQLYDRVALALGETDEVLAYHRAALAQAGPWDFWPRIHALAGIHTLMAEDEKAHDQYDEALFHYQAALALRPDAAEYYAGIGGVLWASGSLDAARLAYLEAHRQQPTDVGAFESAVRISLALGDVDGAKDLLDASGLRSPVVRKLMDDVAIARLLEDITEALENGLETDVRAAYQDLLVRFPDNPRILHALGDTLMRNHKPTDALTVYQRARKFEPANPWLAMAEASAQLELGMPDAAQAILDELSSIDDPKTQQAVAEVRARAFRVAGDRLWKVLERDDAAFEAYTKSLSLKADTWSLSSLAGMYLEHRQPNVSLAFFDAALELDGNNRAARLGRITALQQLGRLDEAREALEAVGRRDAGPEVWAIQDSMEIQQAIQDVDSWVLKGDFRRARKELDAIASRYPDSPHVDAAMGSLMLMQGQPGIALQRAERALFTDPTHGRALAVAMDAGLELGRMQDVVRLMEAALDSGGGEQARVALENALFAATVEKAVQSAKEGRRRSAEQELADLRDAVSDNPDHWALLGGGYLTIDLGAAALDVYERSLEFDPEHVPSLIGKASAIEALGNVREAARVLQEAYEEVPDARIGIALASVQGRLGRWGVGLKTLQSVRDGTGRDSRVSHSRWGRIEPLPVLPLPNGERPVDLPPASMDGLTGRVSMSEVQVLEDELSQSHYPYGDLGGGFVGRTGTAGENLLNSAVLGLAVSEFYAGPFRLQADVLSVLVDNGSQEQLGVSASVGIASPTRSRIGLDVKVGTSPLGFDAGSYLTWLGSLSTAVGPHVAVGADTGRTPITDSLLSWAGTTDETTQEFFGQASSTWGGGYIAMSSPNLTDGGVRFRAGFVEALQMDRVGRQEITAWGGQSLGGQAVKIRIGGNFTWLAHDRQIDQFEVGESGVFSPRSYTVGLVRGNVNWEPNFSGTQFCATAAVGVQSVTGEASPYFQPGVFRAFELGAGLRFPVAEGWKVGLDAKTESTSNVWSQTTVYFRLGHVPGWAGLKSFKDVSPIHGTGVANATVCRE